MKLIDWCHTHRLTGVIGTPGDHVHSERDQDAPEARAVRGVLTDQELLDIRLTLRCLSGEGCCRARGRALRDLKKILRTRLIERAQINPDVASARLRTKTLASVADCSPGMISEGIRIAALDQEFDRVAVAMDLSPAHHLALQALPWKSVLRPLAKKSNERTRPALIRAVCEGVREGASPKQIGRRLNLLTGEQGGRPGAAGLPAPEDKTHDHPDTGQDLWIRTARRQFPAVRALTLSAVLVVLSWLVLGLAR